MLDLLAILKSIIKHGVVSKLGPDDRGVHGAYCSYSGKENVPFEYILPYGVYANPPVGTPLILMSKNGVEANLAGIPYGQMNRFKNLKEGEVKIGNPVSGAYILFSEDTGISQYAPKQMAIVTGDSYTVTCAKDFKVVSQQDVDFTGTVGKNKFNNLQITTISDPRLLSSNATGDVGITDLIDWVHSSSLTVADDGNGGVNINAYGFEPTITVGTTNQYWRGDKTWQNLDTVAVSESTNLYYTNARARSAISASSPIAYNSGTGVISIPRATSLVSGYLHYLDFRVFLNAAKSRSVFLPVLDPDADYNCRRVRRVAASDTYNLNFKMPYDFGNLIAAYLIGFVLSGADGSGKDIDFYSNYTLEPGELYNEYSNSDTTTTYNFTGMKDRRVDIKITALIDPIKPNGEGGITVRHNAIGGIICYLGIWIIYDI